MSTHATAGHNAGPAFQPLSHALGAEIGGIDLTAELNPAAVDAIRAAWNENHILLFRGQKLSPDALIAFARRFGELDRHDATPFYRLEGHPEILLVTNRMIGGKPSETRNTGRNWHSDYSYTNRPAAASMLYCEEKPPVGGDTMFCNMVRAYETLSNKMKRIVDGLEAVYDIGLTAGINERDPQKTAELRRINPPIAHPAVRTHPSSGKKALYVSERASHFHGMTAEESRPLIQFLCAHATRPENVYRHRWQVNDLVLWDNRTTMHIALADFDPAAPRHMLRTTLLGEPSGFVVGG
ncbi:MAG: TauD/TfdA dioxygenase family protein [Alphaproteobacteria bacterium]